MFSASPSAKGAHRSAVASTPPASSTWRSPTWLPRSATPCSVMSDLCLDEFTDHGHCGVLTTEGGVDNDATLEIYAGWPVVEAEAGVDLVGPSGMMDGQVGGIRSALDAAGHKTSRSWPTPRSTPRPSSARSARRWTTRPGRPPHVPAGLGQCAREAVREVLLDVAEGADIVMVKPALAYLDLIRRVRDASTSPSRPTASPASTPWSRPPRPRLDRPRACHPRDADLSAARAPTSC